MVIMMNDIMKDARAFVTAEIKERMLNAGTPDIMFTLHLIGHATSPDSALTRYMFITDLPDSYIYDVVITNKRMYLSVYDLISQKEVPYE